MDNWEYFFRCLEGENFGCLMKTWLGRRLILGNNSVKIVPAPVGPKSTPRAFPPLFLILRLPTLDLYLTRHAERKLRRKNTEEHEKNNAN